MTQLRKITVRVPQRDIEAAQAYTGAGVTETMRTALRKFVSMEAQKRLRELKGTFKFSTTIDELRSDRE